MKEKLIIMKNRMLQGNFVICLAFLIFTFIVRTSAITMMSVSDDLVFQGAFYNFNTFIIWAEEFFTMWSGRVLISAVSVIFLNINITLYRIITTFIIFAMLYAIYKLIYINEDSDKNIKEIKKTQRIVLIFTFIIFFFLHRSVMRGGVLWMTGSFNYLWPVMTMIISLILYIKLIKKVKIRLYEYLIYIPSIIYSSNAEQTGMILVTFGTIAIIITILQKNKINKMAIVTYLISVLILAITLLAPGNMARYQEELLRWYPEFEMLSLGDKLFHGLIHMQTFLFERTRILFLVLSALLAFNSYIKYKRKEKGDNKYKRKMIVSLIPLIFFAMQFSVLEMSLPTFGAETMYYPTAYIPVIIGTFIFIVLAILIYLSYSDNLNKVIYTLLYLAGLATIMSVSVSPTILRSGARIFFVNDILLILVSASILKEILNYQRKLKKLEGE